MVGDHMGILRVVIFFFLGHRCDNPTESNYKSNLSNPSHRHTPQNDQDKKYNNPTENPTTDRKKKFFNKKEQIREQ